ncbi:hypothetical protein [Paenibacillus bouchesdurhonensis]|uniref:hypothetical protein n=1 Tax=Paenibacillus bouchesdurhonensis TaxID=1870990 RepID=UPI000DA609BE|nr:hypothetical protein [Paenibacillus bouchesdurhonensis]
MSNHIDRIQEVKDLTEYAERNTCSATMVPTEALRALLSEYKRLQTIIETQGKLIESYQRIEMDMESDHVQLLELIKRNELCTHMRKTETYKLVDSALSHLKGE